jgi:hypothetical protein
MTAVTMAGIEDASNAKPAEAVHFISVPDEKEATSPVTEQIKAAQETAPEPTLKVRVNAPFRVVHEGVAYQDGDVLEVPNDNPHRIWLTAGWVEQVSKGRK